MFENILKVVLFFRLPLCAVYHSGLSADHAGAVVRVIFWVDRAVVQALRLQTASSPPAAPPSPAPLQQVRKLVFSYKLIF